MDYSKKFVMRENPRQRGTGYTANLRPVLPYIAAQDADTVFKEQCAPRNMYVRKKKMNGRVGGAPPLPSIMPLVGSLHILSRQSASALSFAICTDETTIFILT